jgi:hypothetical protein
MRKIIYVILFILIICVIPGCGKADKTLLYFEKSVDIAGGVWEYEYFPDELVSLVDTNHTLFNKKLIVLNSNETYWEFKAIKPGRFTFCWVYYDPGLWLNTEKSYAEDYIIDDNLEIHSVGNYRPIYEIEKYDKMLFEQYVDQYSRHLEWEIRDYPEVTYNLSGDYETKTVNVVIYNSNAEDEDNIKSITENYLNDYFEVLGELADDYKINITFE